VQLEMSLVCEPAYQSVSRLWAEACGTVPRRHQLPVEKVVRRPLRCAAFIERERFRTWHRYSVLKCTVHHCGPLLCWSFCMPIPRGGGRCGFVCPVPYAHAPWLYHPRGLL